MPTVTLNEFQGATEAQKQFATAAATRLQTVVQNPRFIELVRGANFTSRRYCDAKGNCKSVSNDEIVRIISKGQELETPPNNQINLKVRLRQLRSRTVGSVTPPRPLITTNSIHFNRWMNDNDTLSLAAHWMHEWMHVAGFKHVELSNGDPDRNDVTYRVGRLVVEVGKQSTQETLKLFEIKESDGEGYLNAEQEHLYDIERVTPELEENIAEKGGYKILYSTDIEALQQGVTHSLGLGWKLAGGIATSIVLNNEDQSDFQYLQAVYK